MLSSKKNRSVLVTGGAGYIGSHACKALAQAGYTPVTYDNLVTGYAGAVLWGPLEEGDIADRVRLDNVIRRHRPGAVMHFAAYAYVGESMQDPAKYFRNNVAGSLTLLEAARDNGIDKFIFSSTCATYGAPEGASIREDHPQRPINPYGATKLMVERMLQEFDRAYGMRSISLRYFNAAGADPECDIGEAHNPETHLIPLILDAAIGARPIIEVFGDDYNTPDGTCIRDFIHVCDLADAHLLAMNALDDGAATMAYNLGNGRGFSVREVIEAVEAVTGLAVPFNIVPRRPGDPDRLVGDATRARAELGWSPKFINLTEILETAWRWHAKQRHERQV